MVGKNETKKGSKTQTIQASGDALVIADAIHALAQAITLLAKSQMLDESEENSNGQYLG